MRFDSVGPRTWLLATVAGWAVLAWLLALLGMGGRVVPLADDPGLLQTLPTLRPSPPERLGPLAQYAEIGARPLFSDDRRPRPFSLQPQGEGEVAANTFDYVLSSVLITPRLRMAIVQPTAGGDSIRIKLGEAAEQAPSWRLVTLNPRSAVFAGPEGEKSLDLRVYDGTGGEGPTQISEATDTAMDAAEQPTQPVRAPLPPKSTQTSRPVKPPAATAAPVPAPPESTQASQDAQIEAIRKRIEARRAQMQQQSQQPTEPGKNP